MIQYETETPSRQLMEWRYSNYADHVQWVKNRTITLNWACPLCGKVLVQQRGGLSYDQHELKDMRERLLHCAWRNRKYLRDLEKTKQFLKEINKIVGERHDKELERFQVPTANY
jgi:hypothetical protein